MLGSRSLHRKEALVRLDTGTGRLYIRSAGLNARAFESCYEPPRLVIYELLKSFSESIIHAPRYLMSCTLLMVPPERDFRLWELSLQ